MPLDGNQHWQVVWAAERKIDTAHSMISIWSIHMTHIIASEKLETRRVVFWLCGISGAWNAVSQLGQFHAIFQIALVWGGKLGETGRKSQVENTGHVLHKPVCCDTRQGSVVLFVVWFPIQSRIPLHHCSPIQRTKVLVSSKRKKQWVDPVRMFVGWPPHNSTSLHLYYLFHLQVTHLQLFDYLVYFDPCPFPSTLLL